MSILIKDNETGRIHEYGTNCHDALHISSDGSCLYYENMQNGDGSLGGGYSFVEDDGKIPKESETADAIHAMCYFNIGGFRTEARPQGEWIPVSEKLPERYKEVIVTDIETEDTYCSWYNGNGYWECDNGVLKNRIIAWQPLPEPYKKGGTEE